MSEITWMSFNELSNLIPSPGTGDGEVYFEQVKLTVRPEAASVLLQPPPGRRRRKPDNPGSRLRTLVMCIRLALMRDGARLRL